MLQNHCGQYLPQKILPDYDLGIITSLVYSDFV